MSDPDRITRPPPARETPFRNSWTGTGPMGGNQPPADAAVDEVVAHAVRIGYQVIGENIRQGRRAADRFSAGDYGVRDVPNDLTQLSTRLLQLTRDLSATAFDLFGAVLRDPTLRSALQRNDAPRAPSGFADWPAPGVPPEGRRVPLTCDFRGARHAVAAPAALRYADQPTTLSVAGLWSPNQSLPPLRKISFSAAADGYGVVATIVIPDDQPAGTYSGVVCDGITHLPLGTLTVQVLS